MSSSAYAAAPAPPAAPALPAPPARLVERVRRQLAQEPGPITPGRVATALHTSGLVLGTTAVLAVVEVLRAELSGAGPLEPLLRGPNVTDVLVNGPGSVWVDRGRGVERVDVDVGGESAVRALAVRLAAAAGRRLDDASPCVDARLADGTRLHAVLPPVAAAGTHISLRVPRSRAFTLEELVAAGTLPPAWAPLLRALVRSAAAFLVSGGTGAGKTTLLSTLLGLVDPAHRIVLVEDSAELRPAHPHVVRLESRHANVEGRGGIGLDDLVRQALRMRPDRLVVGECRGAEVRELLAALNTGHEGGSGTVHANSPRDVPARLEALGALAGMSPSAVRAQASSALDVVVHVRREAGLRRVSELAVTDTTEHTGDRHGRLVVLPAVVADPDDRHGAGKCGPGWPALAARLGLSAAWPPVS